MLWEPGIGLAAQVPVPDPEPIDPDRESLNVEPGPALCWPDGDKLTVLDLAKVR